MEKRLRWQWRRPGSTSWRIDETYVKVGGRWAYLYRAFDKVDITRDIRGEARLVERAFGLGACALREAVQLMDDSLDAETA